MLVEGCWSSFLTAASATRSGRLNGVLRPRPREVLSRLLDDGALVVRSDGSRHAIFSVAIGEAEGAAPQGRVEREQAERTIEVGLGYGVGALFICAGLLENGGGAHVAIDPHQATRFANCGLQVLADAGVARLVEFVAEESQIVLPRLLAEERTLDLAVVDGNHRFDGVFLDLIYLGRVVRPGGIVFVDDHQLPAVARAASFCVTSLGWTFEDVSGDDELHHWAVLRTSRSPDRRPFDHFVDF
jgi:predicted O-methyltransferase YrrM